MANVVPPACRGRMSQGSPQSWSWLAHFHRSASGNRVQPMPFSTPPAVRARIAPEARCRGPSRASAQDRSSCPPAPWPGGSGPSRRTGAWAFSRPAPSGAARLGRASIRPPPEPGDGARRVAREPGQQWLVRRQPPPEPLLRSALHRSDLPLHFSHGDLDIAVGRVVTWWTLFSQDLHVPKRMHDLGLQRQNRRFTVRLQHASPVACVPDEKPLRMPHCTPQAPSPGPGSHPQS